MSDGWVAALVKAASRPWVVAMALAIGVGVGSLSPRVATLISPFGTLYLSLLKMLVLPFMVSAITVSLARLLQQGGGGRQVARIMGAFVAAMALTALVGVGAGTSAAPGADLGANTLASLGRLVSSSNSAFINDIRVNLTGASQRPDTAATVDSALQKVIPENIFQALGMGDNLKVVVFSLLFGLAVGATPRAHAASLSMVLETVFLSCQRMLRMINILLPLGLCAMVADLTAKFGHSGGVGPLQAMVKFLGTQLAGAVIVFLMSALTVARRSGTGLWRGLAMVQEPTVMAFCSRNSIACIPSVIDTMSNKLGMRRSDLELVVPLGITLCRIGPVLYYAIATLFIAQLYQVHLGLPQLGFVLFGSIITGVASSGSTGPMTIALLAVVCGPLGLPIQAALALFIAIDPIIDAWRTVLTVHTTCAISTVVCGRDLPLGPAPVQMARPQAGQ